MTPMKHVTPSDRAVIPIEFLVSIPESIWPETIIGPYPPPDIPLLNDAITPSPIIFFHENSKCSYYTEYY